MQNFINEIINNTQDPFVIQSILDATRNSQIAERDTIIQILEDRLQQPNSRNNRRNQPRINWPNNRPNTDDICIICLENINGQTDIIKHDKCSAKGHRNCIYQWLNRSGDICPQCRLQFGKKRSKKRSESVKRSNEHMWKKIVASVKKLNKGGKSGQWSARKAQLAVSLYKKKGGKYLSKKSSKNSLHRWSKQRWRTRSGRPSVMGPNATGERYLPEKVIRKTSKKLYDYSSKLKRRSLKKNKQYSKQPSRLRKKLSKYLKRN